MGTIIGINKKTKQSLSMVHQSYEICVLEIKEGFRKIYVTFAYTSPESLTDLDNIINKIDPFQNQCIFMGDINCRIGKYNGLMNNNFFTDDRQSKDSIINSRGKRLIHSLNKSNFKVMNGNSETDKTGHYTFSNKNGSSVIDLCLISKNLTDNKTFEVLNNEESCHFPILLTLNRNYSLSTRLDIPKAIWNSEKIIDYQENLDNLLQYHDQSQIDIKSMTDKIVQSMNSCKMLTTKNLGEPTITNGPKWFDNK